MGYTLRTWIDKWLAVYKVDIKAHTSYDYKNLLKRYVPDSLMDMPINEIKGFDIQPIFKKIEAHRQREILFTILNNAFRFALGNGLVSFNPVLGVYIKKGRTKKRRAITEVEENKILSVTKSANFRALIEFYIETGARPSEALQVDPVEDFDCNNRRIHLHGTKTENADRYVPITRHLEKVLEDFSPMASKKLFTFKSSYVSHKFKEISRRAGIEDICLYCLRHTFSTRNKERGVPDFVIKSWMGHADKSTTLNVYTDFTERMHNDAMQILDGKKVDMSEYENLMEAKRA